MHPFVLSIVAIFVGAAAAAGTVLFRKLYSWAIPILYGTDRGYNNVNWFEILQVLLGGGAIIGLILYFFRRDRFHGPADVIRSVLEEDGRMPVGQAALAALGSAVAISFGAPVGRYGPAVHLGASLGSAMATRFGLTRTGVNTLLGAGVAAAIGASFDAPIAGVIFAHEVIIGHFALRAFAPITVAAVVGTGVARAWHFDYFMLEGRSTEVPFQIAELPMFALIGLLGAIVAIGLMSTTLGFGKLADRLKIPIALQPPLALGIAALIALPVPEVLGLGESLVGRALTMSPITEHAGAGLWGLLILMVAKMVASGACLGLRIPGGIFAPAVFVGTVLGAAAAEIMPAPYTICTLVGMGAVVSSVVGAPLATILIVFELTGNYEAATAVMVGVVVANAVVTRFFARSFFHRQLRNWKVNLDRTPEARLLGRRFVTDIAHFNDLSISPEASFEEVQRLAVELDGREMFLTADNGKLIGVIRPADILALWDDAPEKLQTLTAADLARPVSAYLAADMSLRVALTGVQSFNGVALPVVNDSRSMELVGYVHESDFIRAYNQAVKDANAERN